MTGTSDSFIDGNKPSEQLLRASDVLGNGAGGVTVVAVAVAVVTHGGLRVGVPGEVLHVT
jgi:hypothetical protein